MASFDAWPVIGVFAAIDAATACGSVYLLVQARRLRRRLERMGATRTTKVAESPLHGPVELAGIARPIDGTFLTAPLSGSACFFWRVQIKEVNGSAITRVAEETDACDLGLDDGSGAVARVRTRSATLGATKRQADPVRETRAEALLARLGVTKPRKDLLLFEDRIDRDADIYVLGEATAPDRGPGGGPFRHTSPERIVVDAPKGGELLISVGHEAALAARLESEMNNDRTIGRAFALGSFVFGLLLAALVVSILRS